MINSVKIIACLALSICLLGCPLVRATGNAVESTGEGIGHAVEGTGDAIGTAGRELSR